MDLFVTNPGTVVAVDSPGIPMNLFVEGWSGYPDFKSILTSFGVRTKSGVEYKYSLRDMVFVYTFGERMTPVRVSGLAFASACENVLDQFDVSNHGLEYAFAYYLNNRVSSRGSPVNLVLGLSTPFVGFLDEATFELVDPERLLGAFSFNFTAVPQPGLLDLLF